MERVTESRSGSAADRGRLERAFAGSVWLLMLGAIAWPVVNGSDGFPLSNYPMFSMKKGEQATIEHVVGFSKLGNHRPMAPEMLGSDEIMQASQTARLAVRGGAATADALCVAVAQRVAADPGHDDIELLQVRRDVFNSVEYWQGNRRSVATHVAASCDVQREPAP